MSGRRLALQLTPLLDLLLIVIFAQYLDVGQRDRRTAGENERLRQSLAETRLQSEVQGNRLARLERVAFEAGEAAERSRTRAAAVTAAASALFHLPPGVVEAAVAKAADGTLSGEERDAIRETFRSLAGGDPQAVVRHLLETAEMRKRVDLWRLHLSPDGTLTLDAAGESETVRADAATVGSGSFTDRLRAIADRLPDGKSLVILTLTYDERVYLSTLEPLREELRGVVASLGRNSRSRFHFADLGYQPAAGAPPAP